MAENPTRARTQILDFPIAEQLISYDPAMVPVCGGVAAALLFCWFEALFLSPHQTPAFIAKTVAEWHAGAGMRQSQFSKSFNHIGVVYMCAPDHIAAKLAGREFWSERKQRHVLYCLELTDNCTRGILLRNRFEIEYALGQRDRSHTPTEYPYSKAGGKLTAKELAKRLHL